MVFRRYNSDYTTIPSRDYHTVLEHFKRRVAPRLMCTLIILRRPKHLWPLVIAANRDEMLTRTWEPPARHWPDRPTTVAGLDQTAGGSWLGINDYGVVAGILNRTGALGPEKGKRSRGELVLEALEHADAKVAADAISDLDQRSYRPFNLVVADNRDAFWIAHRNKTDHPLIEVNTIPTGVSMLTAHDLNDGTCPRTRDFLPSFQSSVEPDPGTDSWTDWTKLMSSKAHRQADGPTEAMNIVTDFGFGTSSSSFIAVPAAKGTDTLPIWKFASGDPSNGNYEFVKFGTKFLNHSVMAK